MAKGKNELNIDAVQKKLNAPASKKFWSKVFATLPTEKTKIIEKLLKTQNLNCHIFEGSVAFRMGKSSIKTIPGYPSGFKSGFSANSNAKDVFESSSYTAFNNVNKQNFVQIAAFYFLYKDPKRVKTESDKTEAAEGEQIALTKTKLTALLKDSKQINLKIGNEQYTVDNFEQVSTRSKTDAYFSLQRKPVVFLSLKKGKAAGDFQQYGGLMDLGIRGENYDGFPDIVEFRNHIDNMFSAFGLKRKNGKYDFNDLKIGSYFGFYLSNTTTACKAIFGKDFGLTNFGLDNCHAAVDGDLNFKRVGRQLNTYELDGEYHITLNPYTYSNRISSFKPDEIYRPVLFVQKSESQGLNQLGYLNARFNIWPNNKVATKGRENLDEIIFAVKSKNKKAIYNLKNKYVKTINI